MTYHDAREQIGLADNSAVDREGTAWLIAHDYHPDGAKLGESSQFTQDGSTCIRREAPAAKGDVAAIISARELAGQETGISTLADDHIDDDPDVSGLDSPQERAIYRAQLKQREFVEAFSYFADLMKPCDRNGLIARGRKALRRLRTIRGDFEREVTVAAVRSDLAAAGMSGWLVRQTLAEALDCGVTTVDTLTRRGNAHLRLAAAMATAKVIDGPEDEQTLSFGPPVSYDKRPTFNLERATEGTRFDSDGFRQAVRELPMLAQHDFIVFLQRQAADSTLDAARKADQRLQKLSHSEIEALEIAGRNTATVRRMLSQLDAAERQTLLADWITEAINAAIAGDSAQRAAASHYTNQEHRQIVADWLEQNDRKSYRQRSRKSLKTKLARRKRATKKAA